MILFLQGYQGLKRTDSKLQSMQTLYLPVFLTGGDGHNPGPVSYGLCPYLFFSCFRSWLMIQQLLLLVHCSEFLSRSLSLQGLCKPVFSSEADICYDNFKQLIKTQRAGVSRRVRQHNWRTWIGSDLGADPSSNGKVV